MKTRTFYILLFVAVMMTVMACGPTLVLTNDEILGTAAAITVTPAW